jgi:hypothetical protein
MPRSCRPIESCWLLLLCIVLTVGPYDHLLWVRLGLLEVDLRRLLLDRWWLNDLVGLGRYTLWLIVAGLTTCYELRVMLGPLLRHINYLGTIRVLLSLRGRHNLRLISLIIIIRRVIFNRCSRIYYLLLLIIVMIFIEVMVGVMHYQALLVSH